MSRKNHQLRAKNCPPPTLEAVAAIPEGTETRSVSAPRSPRSLGGSATPPGRTDEGCDWPDCPRGGLATPAAPAPAAPDAPMVAEKGTRRVLAGAITC